MPETPIISVDTGIIIDGYDLLDIYQGVSRIGGGGQVSISDLALALETSQGGILNQIQFYSWASVIMLFVGLYAIPFIKNKGKIRKSSDVPEFSETYGESAPRKLKHDGQLKKGDPRIHRETPFERRIRKGEKKIKEYEEKIEAHRKSLGYRED